MIRRKFRHRHLAIPRKAEVVAEFLHPETDAPMVTWYQTSEISGEEPSFYTAHRKEFMQYFPNEISP